MWDVAADNDGKPVEIQVTDFFAKVEQDYVLVSNIKFDCIQEIYISLDLREQIRFLLEQMFNLWWKGEKHAFDIQYGHMISEPIFNYDETNQIITGSICLKHKINDLL